MAEEEAADARAFRVLLPAGRGMFGKARHGSERTAKAAAIDAVFIVTDGN